MVDFGNLEALEVKDGTTAVLTLEEINGDNPPTLTLAPAGQSNKAYNREALRRNRQFDALIAGRKLSPKLIEEIREADTVLYAKHVVKGWKNVVDNEGKAVPFNEENATAFFQALPRRFFDMIRGFCQDAENFVDMPDLAAMSTNFKRGSSGN